MQKIVRPSDLDMESLGKCFRRVLVDHPSPFLSTFDENVLSEAQGNGALFILKEAKRVYASAMISHDIADSFFPVSHSQRKADDLLDLFAWNGEPLIVIRLFFVDPAWQRNGIGAMLLKDLFARYGDASFLCCVEENNVPAIRFFEKMGFVSLGERTFEYPVSERQLLLVKPFAPKGLCREVRW